MKWSVHDTFMKYSSGTRSIGNWTRKLFFFSPQFLSKMKTLQFTEIN